MPMTSEMQAPTLEVGGSNLPLKNISVSGEILSSASTLRIKQKFINGEAPADVTYHCPLHPDWAVRNITMRCDEREISTIVLPNEKASQVFDEAKQAGNTAILADEVASDEMRLQLANVPAKTEVEVETEIVTWPQVENGRGSYIIPLINGPKYGGTEAQQAFLDEDDPGAKHTSCSLDLKMGVRNPSSDFGEIVGDAISGEIEPVGQVRIQFDTEIDAMWHEDETGRYLVVGIPIVRTEKDAPKWGSTALLIDQSGSMSGQGLSAAQEMGRHIADHVGEGIKMIYSFESSPHLLWTSDGKTDISAKDAISHIASRGGTDLLLAFQKVLSDLAQAPGHISDLIIITDALISQVYYKDLIDSVKKLNEIGVALHVAIVGPAPGRFIGECLSYASGGFYIEQSGSRFDTDELKRSADRFLIGGQTLRNIKIGRSNFKCDHPVRGRPAMIAISDVPKKRPDEVKVKFEGMPEIDVKVSDHPEARFLWAKEKVMEIVRSSWSSGSMFDDRRDEIERIGVDHQILTPYTSFVGVDGSQAIDRNDVQQVIAQSSLPTGIDAYAFHGGVSMGGSLGIASASINCFAVSGSGQDMTTPRFYSAYHTTSPYNIQGDTLGQRKRYGSAAGTSRRGIGGRGFSDESKMHAWLPECADMLPPSPDEPMREAATILLTILGLINEKKGRGESFSPSDISEIVLSGFGDRSVIIAGSALRKAGLDEIATELVKIEIKVDQRPLLTDRTDVHDIAREIASAL